MESIVKVHQKYLELIGKENPYSVCELSDRHMLNINYFKNQRKECIDRFTQHYAMAYRILEPRMRSMCRLVHVAKVGGHVELKEPGYTKTYHQWRTEVDNAIRMYNFIIELENSIANEYAAIEIEKSNKLKSEYELSELFNSPVIVPAGKQLEITF
jgi:hypothetical protein